MQALIFDCDGVLVDTERDGHRVAFNRAFQKMGLSHEWSVARYGELLKIAGGKERMRHFFNAVGWPENVPDRDRFIQQLHHLKTDLFMEIIESGELPLRPGVARLVDDAISAGIRLAVCSTSNARAVNLIVEKLLGAERHACELFRSGEIGPVRKVIVQYLQDFLMYPHEKEGQKQAVWRVDPQQSGMVGTMGDVGSHAENLLNYITGEEITELCADFSTFLPDRQLDEDANVLVRLKGGGKGVIFVSQVATGEENNLRIKIYAANGAVLWEQENPNYLQIYRYGQPRQILTRAQGYLSPAAAHATRIPTGHPEGYLEAFANIYVGVVAAIRRSLDGQPLPAAEYNFPTVYDGLRGMRFITRAATSAKNGSVWVKM